MSSTSTISTATTGAGLAHLHSGRRHGRAREITTVLRALAARAGASMSAAPTLAPSNRRVGPITRDYALDPAYHLRMVR